VKHLRIATWNIAGGRKARSAQRFDYRERDLSYFAEQLRAIDVNVVCLQEVEYAKGEDFAAQLAGEVGLPYIFQTPMHPSHIDAKYEIAQVMLSRQSFSAQRAVAQPYPTFPLHLPSGAPAQRFVKHLQIAEIGGVQIGNVQTQPLEFLGTPYESERGRRYAAEVSEMFVRELRRPVLLVGDFCADFRTRHVADIFGSACGALALSDALPLGHTKPHAAGRPDAIFASPEFAVVDSAIVPTETDHFLCWAELAYADVKEGA